MGFISLNAHCTDCDLCGADESEVHDPKCPRSYRAGVKDEVAQTIGERGKRYGTYARTAAIIQNIKAAMRDSPSWPRMEPHMRESLDMIANKMGRILSGDFTYVDSWHDIGGYARLVEEILKGNDP